MTDRIRRTRRRLRGDDRGALAPAVAILLVPLFLLTGLIVDGARYLDASSTAQAYAEEAARAGAMQVDLSQPNLALLPESQVAQAVAEYCQTIVTAGDAAGSSTSNLVVTDCRFEGISDTSLGNPLIVNTQVTVQIRTWLLGLVDVNSLSRTVTASAEPQEGVTTPLPN